VLNNQRFKREALSYSKMILKSTLLQFSFKKQNKDQLLKEEQCSKIKIKL
jgi:hypothetical protein